MFANAVRKKETRDTRYCRLYDLVLCARVVDSVLISVITSWVLSSRRVSDTGTMSSSGDTASYVRPVRVDGGRGGSSSGSDMRGGVVGVLRDAGSGRGCRVESRLAMLVVGSVLVRAHASLLSGVAIAHLVGVGVGRKSVLVDHVGLPLAAEAEKTAATLTGTGGVAVSWTGAEALLLAAVADEGKLDEGRQEEEDAGGCQYGATYTEYIGCRLLHSNDGDG